MKRGFDQDHYRMNGGSHHSGPDTLEHQLDQTSSDSPSSDFPDYNDPELLDKHNQEWREQNQVPDIFDPPSTESENALPQVPLDLRVYSKPFSFEGQFETDWRIHVGHAIPVEEPIFGSGKSAPTPESDRRKESTKSKANPDPVTLVQDPQLESSSSELPAETKEVPETTLLKVPSPAVLDSNDQDAFAGNERPTLLADTVNQSREVDIGDISGTPVVSTDDNESNEVEGHAVQQDLVQTCPVCGADIQIRSGDTFNFKRHVDGHRQAGELCPICHKVIKRKDNIGAHIRDKHKIVGRCPDYNNCRTEFKGRCKISEMARHLAEPNEGEQVSACLEAARSRWNAEPQV